MGTKEFEDSELEGLSAAELAAIAGDDEELPTDPEDDPADPADDPDPVDPADPGEPTDPLDPADPADPADPIDEPADPKFVPQFAVAGVENYDVKVGEINTKITGLREQMESGELTLSEYEAQKDALVEERSELKHQQRMADFAESQNAEQSKVLWEHEQKKFFKTEANQAYMKDTILFSVLDAAVKTIANNPKNAAMGPDEVLAEADRQVRARMLVPGDKPKPKPLDRTIDRSKLVPTLHGLPSAEIPETGIDAEFGYLDKLQGMDLERALAKMSPEQEARYLQG